GCPEVRTTGAPDFRALRKVRPRRRTTCFLLRGHSCLAPCLLRPETIAENENAPRHPLKSSQDCVTGVYLIDITFVFVLSQAGSDTRSPHCNRSLQYRL